MWADVEGPEPPVCSVYSMEMGDFELCMLCVTVHHELSLRRAFLSPMEILHAFHLTVDYSLTDSSD